MKPSSSSDTFGNFSSNTSVAMGTTATTTTAAKAGSPNVPKDLTGTLMENNLRQMQSRMPSSLSMPMGMSTPQQQQQQHQQQPMLNSSPFYPSPNDNLSHQTSMSGFHGGSNLPRSQTTFNLNNSSAGAGGGGLLQPRLNNQSVMNSNHQKDSNVKILSKQDIDEFLR